MHDLNIPLIDPNRIVTHAVSAILKGPVLLNFPMKACDVTCPDCQGRVGFYNYKWNAWSCTLDCLDKWKYISYSGNSFKFPEVQYQNLVKGLPEAMESAKLESCEQSHQFKKEWIEWLKNAKLSLILAGPVGVGKTYAACALLNEYSKIEKKSSEFVNVSDLFLQWKNAILNNGDMQMSLNLISKDLIVLDDLGNRTPSESFLDFLYVVMSKRVDLNKPTIITTNLTAFQLREKLGEALTSRITFGKAYKLEGSDRRVLSW